MPDYGIRGKLYYPKQQPQQPQQFVIIKLGVERAECSKKMVFKIRKEFFIVSIFLYSPKLDQELAP